MEAGKRQVNFTKDEIDDDNDYEVDRDYDDSYS